MTTKWTAKPAWVVAQMPYEERIAYEAERRAAMAAAGVTEQDLRLSPQGLMRKMMTKLGKGG